MLEIQSILYFTNFYMENFWTTLTKYESESISVFKILRDIVPWSKFDCIQDQVFGGGNGKLADVGVGKDLVSNIELAIVNAETSAPNPIPNSSFKNPNHFNCSIRISDSEFRCTHLELTRSRPLSGVETRNSLLWVSICTCLLTQILKKPQKCPLVLTLWCFWTNR